MNLKKYITTLLVSSFALFALPQAHATVFSLNNVLQDAAQYSFFTISSGVNSSSKIHVINGSGTFDDVSGALNLTLDLNPGEVASSGAPWTNTVTLSGILTVGGTVGGSSAVGGHTLSGQLALTNSNNVLIENLDFSTIHSPGGWNLVFAGGQPITGSNLTLWGANNNYGPGQAGNVNDYVGLDLSIKVPEPGMLILLAIAGLIGVAFSRGKSNGARNTVVCAA